MIYFGFCFLKNQLDLLFDNFISSISLSIYIILINVTLSVSYFFSPLCVFLSPYKYPSYIHVLVLWHAAFNQGGFYAYVSTNGFPFPQTLSVAYLSVGGLWSWGTHPNLWLTIDRFGLYQAIAFLQLLEQWGWHCNDYATPRSWHSTVILSPVHTEPEP